MAGFRLTGNTSCNTVEVGSCGDGYKELNYAFDGYRELLGIVDGYSVFMQPSINEDTIGYAAGLSQPDAGALQRGLIDRIIRPLDETQDYRLRVGIDTLLFNDTFSGTVLNKSLWRNATNSMTTAVNMGYVHLNDGYDATAGSYSTLRTYRHFPIYGTFGCYGEFVIKFSTTSDPFSKTEFGFGLVADDTGTTPYDGVYIRVNGTDSFKCVINYGGSETTSADFSFDGYIGTTKASHFTITVGFKFACFWINQRLMVRIPLPETQPAMTSSNNLPFFIRTCNPGASNPSFGQRPSLALCNISLVDIDSTKVYNHTIAGMGGMLCQAQTGQTVQGPLGNYGTNDDGYPGAFYLLNTDGYAGLGGLFISNIDRVAVTTDYIVQKYQNPTTNPSVPGKSLYVLGVKVSAVNYGVTAHATLPLTWSLFVCAGHKTATLATATDTGTAKMPRRIPIGTQTLPAASVVGTLPTPAFVSQVFQAPILVQPGEFLEVVIRFHLASIATGQQIYFTILYDGYWV